jgi:23S rRNA (adenine2030-N6)-methyltransferase
MNYRHAFHAGNFADIAKHLALIAAIGYLQKKPGAIAVIDTHGGPGKYDLSGREARRTGEAETGIRRLSDISEAPPLLSHYLTQALNPEGYAGSPLLAARMLRLQDRLVAVEKHPEDAQTLRQTLAPYAKAKVEEGDGYRRLAALTPPPERRGVILMDPPFEAPDEFAIAAKAFATAYRHFATGVYLLWFPIKSDAEANGFCGEVLTAGPKKVLRLDVRLKAPPEGKLAAAGLLIINPPWSLEADLAEALAPVLPRLEAETRFDWLSREEAP